MMTDYTETEYKGEVVRQWPDGALRRPDGTLVARHPKAAAIIDKDISQDYNLRKVAKRKRDRDDFQAEAQRALVSELARGKSLAQAGSVLVRNVAEELAQPGAAKEHGLKNYTGASDWALTRVGLIEEKTATHDNRSVNIDSITLDLDVKEHVAMLLAKLSE